MIRPRSFLTPAAPAAALALALFLLLGLPQAAAAHAALVRAEPGAGQVLTAPPSEVRLWFSEPAAPDFSTVQVLDRARQHYETGPLNHPNGDQTALRIALLPDLPSGTYTVLTHVVSAADGHLTEARFAFLVRRAGEPTPTPGAEPLPPEMQPGPESSVPTTTVADVSPVRWLVRALALIMAAWLLGGPLFTVLVLEPALAPLPRAGRAAGRRPAALGPAGHCRGDNFDTPPVLGAAVTATFALTDGTALPVSYHIPTEPTLGASGYYERVVTIPSDGNWQVTVAVSAPLGTASASFPVRKRSPPVPTEWITWATIALPVLVVILVFVYLWRVQRAAGPRIE